MSYNSFRKLFFVLSANIFVLVVVLSIVEIGWRIGLIVQSCAARPTCITSPITKLQVVGIKKSYIGFSRPDEELGYVPREGFDQIIHESNWHNAHVTINEDGFRSNGNSSAYLPKGRNIIASGDSFTFGDQVSNEDTWPACLEKTLSTRVDNAGVFGYGPVQVVERLKKSAAKKPYDIAIIAILVGHDLTRDQLIYRDGFPKPYLQRSSSGDIAYMPPPFPYEVGTKFNPGWNKGELLRFLFENSIIANNLITKIGAWSTYSDLSKKVAKPATKAEIIEWTTAQIKSLTIPKKIVLLQYDVELRNQTVSEERDLIRNQLDRSGISYIDTYDALASANPTLTWDAHHTPYGNQLVCKSIISYLEKNNKKLTQ